MSSESEKETVEKETKAAKPTTEKTPEKPTPAKKTAPTKEEPELPAFEKGIADKIVEKFGEKTTVTFVKPDRVVVKKQRLHL
jgi:NADH-quinone oxidoreductase subunit C